MNIKKYDLKEFFLGLVLLTLPISMKLNSVAIILAVVYFFVQSLREKSLGNLKYYTLSIAFFAAQLISFFISDDGKQAESKLVLYLSFLLFPIIFSNAQINAKFQNFKLIRWLFYGTVIVLLYATAMFLHDVIVLDERYDYGRASKLFLKYAPHHVYLSMFIIISIFGVLNAAITNKKYRYFLFFIPFFYLALILLSSRMAILIAVLVLPLVTYFILRKKMNKKLTNRIILGFFTLLIVLGFTNDFARDKILHTYYELANIATKENPFVGISFRQNIWTSAIELIKESPWIGYGVGDTQSILDAYYEQQGFEKLLRFNAHNQYLQWALHHGIIITVLLLLFVFNAIRKLIQNKAYFLVFCWFILFTFSLTESILNRQWGVVLFAFVLNFTLYTIPYFSKHKKEVS